MIAPVPDERPIDIVPADPVDGIMLGIAKSVPVAFWKFRYVIVPVVAVRVARLAIPVTLRFVEVAPIPAIVRPPSIVVVTFVEPMWIPPRALRPVPIEIVVVPGPVPIFTVLEVPIPRDSV